jgi:hypothetical protein
MRGLTTPISGCKNLWKIELAPGFDATLGAAVSGA